MQNECYQCYGLNWFTLETGAVLLFVLLHISMVVFIVRQGKTDKAFHQAFYILFVATTVADCYRIIEVSRPRQDSRGVAKRGKKYCNK